MTNGSDVKRQALGYVHRYGPGAVVYWFGGGAWEVQDEEGWTWIGGGLTEARITPDGRNI